MVLAFGLFKTSEDAEGTERFKLVLFTLREPPPGHNTTTIDDLTESEARMRLLEFLTEAQVPEQFQTARAEFERKR